MELIICVLIILLLALFRKIKKVEKEFQAANTAHSEQVERLNNQLIDTRRERDAAKAHVVSCQREISMLKSNLEETNKKLKFYKNIEEDSDNLNVSDHSESRQRLLEQATEQIKAKRIETQKSGLPHPISHSSTEALLDCEQASACDKMEHSCENFFITGKAGTGKSFLLDVFRKTTDKSHIVLAPTGIAALNVNGATLHSTFGYYNLVNLDVDAISASTLRLKSEKRITLRSVSAIIIDEISMVRADTFEKIDRILKVINQNNLPFGGKQILLFGDLFQLPPVTKAKEFEYLLDRYGGIYFFCSDAYKRGKFQFMELTINHRQKDDAEYFSLLNRIRDGSVTSEDIDILNSRVIHDTSIYDRFTTLLPTKAEVESLNQYHINQLDSVGYTYHARVVLNKHQNNNRNLESVFPIANSLYLKNGALVMMVANDPEHRWVNGSLGIVRKLSNDGISVTIKKRTYDIHPFDFTEQEITYTNGKITYEDVLKVKQYPIVPAYAITIHKSQGQTYQNIVCDIDRCFANGQAYVALSRCASLEGLHLKRKISGASIRVDKCVLDFYNTQKEYVSFSASTDTLT